MREPVQAVPSAGAGPGLRVHAVLIGVQILFGIFHVVAKVVLSEMAPLALAGLRVLGAAPVLLAVAWYYDRAYPKARDLPVLALLGFLGVFVNQIFFILGLARTTATNASILMVSIPVLAVAAAAALGIETLGPRRLLGVALSVSGALVLVGPSRLQLGSREALGNALILANCLGYACFLVLQRPVLRRLPWRTVIAWAFFFGGAGVLAVAFPELHRLQMAKISGRAWLGLLYISFFATALNYALSTWAVRRSSPTLVAAYSTLQPMAASLLAAI
ncbi:MAG TPA: DMT family transporter, partial [Thermoanaerobaculia bacterium]|nr:DMT family transporter [Thermoanaerobaculia bacterium]